RKTNGRETQRKAGRLRWQRRIQRSPGFGDGEVGLSRAQQGAMKRDCECGIAEFPVQTLHSYHGGDILCERAGSLPAVRDLKNKDTHTCLFQRFAEIDQTKLRNNPVTRRREVETLPR